jgi:hypothetical protein
LDSLRSATLALPLFAEGGTVAAWKRLERRGEAATAAYEPGGDPPRDTALLCSIVDALAMRATGVLRPRVFIETCKYAAHEPHYQKTWVFLVPRHE